MNLTKSLKLSPHEVTILKRVLLISTTTCGLLVLTVWAVQRLRLHSAGPHPITTPTPIDPVTRLADNDELLPIDLAAHHIAADHHTRAQQPAKAIQHLLRILAADRHNRHIKLELATAYLKAGDYQAAYRRLNELVEADEQDSLTQAAEARLGLTLFYLGRPDESARRLDACLQRYPRSHEAACYRGQVEASITPSSPRILAYFNQALSLTPTYGEARYQRARYYMNRPGADSDDYHRARTDLLALLDHQPLHAKAHSRLGMVYYYLGQFDAAISSYRTALALNPSDYNTHYNLGETLYLGLDNPAKALKHYRAALAIDSLHVQANFRVGLIALANEATNEAVLHLQRAVESEPDNIRFRLQLAVAYEREGMIQRAESTYRTVLELDPLHTVARQKLALLER
jgi:tetratricopeptide (TPR) repeat protein